MWRVWLRSLWGKSIRWQLICSVAMVHALLMFIFVVGLVLWQKQFLLAKARQRIEFQTRLLADTSEHEILTHDLAGLSEVLSNIARDKTVRYAMVTDSDGHVLAHTERTRVGQYLTDASSLSVLRGSTAAGITSQGERTVAASAPIMVMGHAAGWAWVARDLSDDRAYLQDVVIGGLTYTLTAAAVGTLFAIILAGAILRPLQLLLAGAGRFAQDRLDEPIPITTDNEVGTVTRAFNAAMAKVAEQRDALLKEVGERTRAKLEAEESNRAKDHFLAVLSHELRTPLTPVLTLAQMLEHDPELPIGAREDITTIRRNVELEAHLIDDLLDLTRISRGKLELRFVAVDIHEKLRQVARMCQEDARSKRLDVSLELWAPHAAMQADSTRLQQVFWNVLRNAIKFTPPGGRIAIQTHNEPHVPRKQESDNARREDPREDLANNPGEDLIVEVSDTGIGIEKSKLASVFEAFEQGGREVTRLFGGLGLGLTISKAIVDLHGGLLTAHSEGEDRGATFRVQLPMTTVVAGPVAPPQAAPAVHARQRILLVEDHPDTAMATSRLLKGCGYEVQTADSVASAVQLARKEHFDLIVSDIGLPDGTGHELIRRLVAEAPTQGGQLKSIAISGFGRDDDLQRSREAGFINHLVKPFDPKALLDAVDSALESEPVKEKI